MTLEQFVGQHLMIGIPGTKLTPEIVNLFQETHAGGLIVFRPNFESAQSFKKLISDLEEALQRKLLVAVDHEGGRVIHLAEGITVFPDNLVLGQTGNEDYARRQGEIEAKELRRLGIDLNLAPTVDVLTDSFSSNIGIRSYGKNSDLVSRLGAARIQAMQKGGLSACAKHFPGQGHSSIDAHLGLPVLPTTWEEMKSIHIKPFIEAIKAGVDAVMSSHPVYPNLDPLKVPATFSKRIIKKYLRNELGFRGVILSDDLEMGALRNFGMIGESAVKAVSAGHDLVLICHDMNAARQAFDSLLNAYQDGILNVKDLQMTFQRIEKLKNKRKQRFEGGEPKLEVGAKELVQQICVEGIGKSVDNKKPLNSKTVSVIFPKLSELDHRIMIEEEMTDEKKFIEQLFAEHNATIKALELISFDPSPEEINKTLSLSKASDTTLFFCFDAHLYPQTKKLLDELQGTCRNLAVILLRNPYDAELVKAPVVCVSAFGFRIEQIKAVVEILFPSNIPSIR